MDSPGVFPGTFPSLRGLHKILWVKFSAEQRGIRFFCDKPLFETALGTYLADRTGDFDAVAPITRDGRIQPLCAVYAKSCAEILLRQIQKGNYRLTAALRAIRTVYIPLSQTAFPDRLLTNINTPADYRRLLQLYAPGASFDESEKTAGPAL